MPDRDWPKYYQEHKEARLETQRKWRGNHPDLKKAQNDEYKKEHRKELLAYYRLRAREKKRVVMIHYGGKCVCCGEARIEFLSVDHVNGGGEKQKRELGIGSDMYSWLIRNNFPEEGYRVLCFNCNMARGFYGYCPHDISLHDAKGTLS